MSNPGPSVTQTNHPTNLATNQALRLIASAQGVNLNAVADTVATVLVNGSVVAASVLVSNASVSLSTAQLAVWTGPAGTGTEVKTAYALSANTTSAKAIVTGATSTDAITGTPLYIRCAVAQGSAATADVFIYGYDLTFLP